MNDKSTWADSLNRDIGGGVRASSAPGYAVALILPCSTCHKDIEWLSKQKLPPPVIAKKLRQTGWQIGRHLKCPSCVKTRPNAIKSPQPMPQNSPPPPAKVDSLASLDQLFAQQKPEPKPVSKADLLGSLSALFDSPAPAPSELLPEHAATVDQKVARPAEKPAPSAPNKVAKAPAKAAQPAAKPRLVQALSDAPVLSKTARAAVMRSLEQYFQPELGTYIKGQSDAKIAAKSEATTQQVAELRKQWFGELSESPELTAARAEVESYRLETEEFVNTAKAELARRKAHLRTLRERVRQLES